MPGASVNSCLARSTAPIASDSHANTPHDTYVASSDGFPGRWASDTPIGSPPTYTYASHGPSKPAESASGARSTQPAYRPPSDTG